MVDLADIKQIDDPVTNCVLMKKHIAFAGGSSWGHVVPISTLIQELSSRDEKLFWFWEKNGLEYSEFLKLKDLWINNLWFVSIVSWKWRRKASMGEFFQNICDLLKFSFGIIVSLYYLKKYNIDSIFSKWGFVSLPVVIAGRMLRLPIAVHESDSRAGISTKIAARFATKIFTGFPDVLPGSEYAGQILSDKLLNHLESSQPSNLATSSILVNCGSLGSASVHEAILELFKKDPSLVQRFQWIVLLGKLNTNFLSDYKKYPEIECYDYIDQQKMWSLYEKADLSICRGGSTTLTEQHIFGIKQIIIPIPWTHDQKTNAEFFVKEYGDVLINQWKIGFSEALLEALEDFSSFKKQSLDKTDIENKLSNWREKIVSYISQSSVV